MQQPPPLPSVNPYAAPASRVSDMAEGDLELADRGTRLGAAILDGLVMVGPIVLVSIAAAIVLPGISKEGSGAGGQALVGVVGLIVLAVFVAIAVINLVLLHRHGQSIAKRWLKIRIVRTDGSRCGLLRVIFARALPTGVLGALPLIGWLFALGDSLLIFRDDYRCLHDHFADTIVVKA